MRTHDQKEDKTFFLRMPPLGASAACRAPSSLRCRKMIRTYPPRLLVGEVGNKTQGLEPSVHGGCAHTKATRVHCGLPGVRSAAASKCRVSSDLPFDSVTWPIYIQFQPRLSHLVPARANEALFGQSPFIPVRTSWFDSRPCK